MLALILSTSRSYINCRFEAGLSEWQIMSLLELIHFQMIHIIITKHYIVQLTRMRLEEAESLRTRLD